MSETVDDNDLEHAGVKGMKWGVRKDDSSSSAPRLSSSQKKVMAVAITTGAAVAASMIAGPIGGLAVSGLSRIAGEVVSVRTTSDGGVVATGGKDGEYQYEVQRRGDGSLSDLTLNPDYKR